MVKKVFKRAPENAVFCYDSATMRGGREQRGECGMTEQDRTGIGGAGAREMLAVLADELALRGEDGDAALRVAEHADDIDIDGGGQQAPGSVVGGDGFRLGLYPPCRARGLGKPDCRVHIISK